MTTLTWINRSLSFIFKPIQEMLVQHHDSDDSCFNTFSPLKKEPLLSIALHYINYLTRERKKQLNSCTCIKPTPCLHSNLGCWWLQHLQHPCLPGCCLCLHPHPDSERRWTQNQRKHQRPCELSSCAGGGSWIGWKSQSIYRNGGGPFWATVPSGFSYVLSAGSFEQTSYRREGRERIWNRCATLCASCGAPCGRTVSHIWDTGTVSHCYGISCAP